MIMRRTYDDIPEYERITDFELTELPEHQGKTILRFREGYDAFFNAYIGIIFTDKTFIYGTVEGDDEDGHGFIWRESIDYKAAYELGLIDKSEYDAAAEESKRDEINAKRAQLEKLRKEIGE
jgi:hypothetical protein